jgi:hypothetical protein
MQQRKVSFQLYGEKNKQRPSLGTDPIIDNMLTKRENFNLDALSFQLMMKA